MTEDASAEDRNPTAPRASIGELLRHGRRRLAPAKTETPALDAEVLLRHVLGVDRTALLSRLADPAPADARARYESLLEQRLGGIPVAYLIGYKEFMGIQLTVSPAVLIPRPETEILVEWALEWLRDRQSATVVDVGTGSGAIALSLATSLGPDWVGRIVASDVSPDALVVAAINRERLAVTDRVVLVEGSILAWCDEPVDLLLANLPYLRPDQIGANPALAAEPRLALDGGEAGLGLIAALLRDAPRVVRPGGAVGLEIDPGQAPAIVSLAGAAFPGARIGLLPDLAGLDRDVTIETTEPAAAR
jgi:release factor glutamine methyltransferase